MGDEEDLSTWSSHLEDVLRAAGSTEGPLDRVRVLAETESTQDAAQRMCDGRPGLVVIAGRQTRGRGRLGRAWADTSHLGVAMTCVLDGTRYDDAKLSLAAGYAALVGCRESDYALRCRWPNDVVENKPPHRKVAGVLIEKTRGLAFVGIGVNVLHRDSDWPEDLRGRAVSLKRLGFGNFRISVAQRVLFYLFQGLAMSNRALAEEWRHHDILIGTKRAFVHNNHQYFGLVVDIDPLNAIRLRMADGREVGLPAHSTSLVHE